MPVWLNFYIYEAWDMFKMTLLQFTELNKYQRTCFCKNIAVFKFSGGHCHFIVQG